MRVEYLKAKILIFSQLFTCQLSQENVYFSSFFDTGFSALANVNHR